MANRSADDEPQVRNKAALYAALVGDTPKCRGWAKKTGRAFQFSEFAARLKGKPDPAAAANLLHSANYDLKSAIATLRLLDRLLFTPESIERPSGRPKAWSDEAVILAWLEVECHHRAIKATLPKATVSQAIAALFEKVPRSSRGIPISTQNGNTVFLTRQTAKKQHLAARQLLKQWPVTTQARWDRIASRAANALLDDETNPLRVSR